MTGTDLKIITPAAAEVLGPDVHRLATLHTNARTDLELLAVWLKSHADGSPAHDPSSISGWARASWRPSPPPASTLVFGSIRRPGQPLTERAVNYIVKEAAERAGVNPAASIHWLRHAHASHAIDNGAPITLVSATLGHPYLKTTSVYAHARPGESSGRYLKTK